MINTQFKLNNSSKEPITESYVNIDSLIGFSLFLSVGEKS